ncbi:MAG: hypothetical protein AAGB15_08185 [Pseudomonadota bacterium]
MKIKKSHAIKMVTCCYCGARSTLPTDRAQRLVCHGCGAAMKKIEALQPTFEKQKSSKTHAKPAAPHPAEREGRRLKDKDRPARRKKGKKRQVTIWHRLRDAVDDLDDVFDIFD